VRGDWKILFIRLVRGGVHFACCSVRKGVTDWEERRKFSTTGVVIVSVIGVEVEEREGGRLLGVRIVFGRSVKGLLTRLADGA